MKINQVVKQTGVPKETIHFYIREGLLRKPRKSGVNAANYNEHFVEQVLLIKNIRANYHLPIPEIKKIIKKYNRQSSAEKACLKYYSKFYRPLDRLLTTEVVGKDAFIEATGLGKKWMEKAEEWGIFTPTMNEDGQRTYCSDDVTIGKLMVDMDHQNFGPSDGGDPEDLRIISDFIRKYIMNSFKKFYKNNLEKLSVEDFDQQASVFHEIISLFFYHLYRKTTREAIRIYKNPETKNPKK